MESWFKEWLLLVNQEKESLIVALFGIGIV